MICRWAGGVEDLVGGFVCCGAGNAEGWVAVESVDYVVPQVLVVVDCARRVEDSAVGGQVGELKRCVGTLSDGVFEVEAAEGDEEVEISIG